MAVKTFEREVKQLSSEFTNLIENYNFEQYDFHSIRQTLQDYIEQTYPNYNDFFRSDYVMMLIELFAFYGEMMAYRVDMNMNEAYLSTAKDRKNIIKIADMLGYKYARIEPSSSIVRIDISDEKGGSRLISKKKIQGTINDILSKTTNITFTAMASDATTYHPYKLDYLLKSVTAEEFINTLNNIFIKLEDFSQTTGIKTKKIIENNFEYYERSMFIDKFQMGFNANSNVYVEYAGSRKMFEVQSLSYDETLYFNTEKTEDSLQYNKNSLYNGVVELGFEFVLKYDKGNNIIDKNVYLYMPVVQGGSFTREITVNKTMKSFKDIAYEKNIFNNPTSVKQFDENNNLIRTYIQVDNLSNNPYRYAYEVNNTPDGFIELLFGDGKNAEVLLPAAKTLLYYRKNPINSDEIYNVKNADVGSISLDIQYFDSNVGQTQTTILPLYFLDKFSSYGGTDAESDEQIKYMAKKLRSVQDRFVTGSDYETAGMLHPRVKYTTVMLRTYIGKNSSRMSNEYIDVYFDSMKNNVSTYIMSNTSEVFLIVPTAYFTESTVPNMSDLITFIDTNNEYYFEIFDADTIPANEWYKYPDSLIASTSKGTVLKIINKLLTPDDKKILTDINKLNTILPFEYSLDTAEYIGSTEKIVNFKLVTNKIFDIEKLNTIINNTKETILNSYNNLVKSVVFSDINLVKTTTGFTLSLIYSTPKIELPPDLSFVWTHYKSDDIFINPSKSNIIEIYVTGIKKDFKKGISVYEPLSSSEINKLVSDIEKRKMISDVVQVYNSSVYSIPVALKVYKSTTSNITNEMLKSKIDKSLDNFFDIVNIPLGKHFYMSKLIEWLHKNIPEIQHIELLTDSTGKTITPSSTLDLLGDKITYTQIVETTQIVNEITIPKRQIEIIS